MADEYKKIAGTETICGPGVQQKYQDTGDGHALVVSSTARAMGTSKTHAPAADTAAVVTLAAAGEGVSHVITGIYFGYDDTPTGGSLTVTDGGSTVFQIPVTAAGAGFIPFDPPLKGTANSEVVVTLAAGGGSVSGAVNVNCWTE
jgi:hypothetical protein